ncbi:MAG: hypothetical protein LBQ22_04320 [Bacteroidales bacterium]|jgi:heme/copper-type cytochrome/quinol oxidase subunit 4|nr:hypothetical protein [Bacteroidales bacterium]
MKDFIYKVLDITNKIFESVWFKWLIFILFLLLTGFLKYEHIFERDEAQPLLIILGNRNFFDLVSTFAYEGTTGLWYVFLWILSFLMPITPQSVSIIHFLFIGVFIWYFLFKIEIPFILKIIFLTHIGVFNNFIYVRQYILVLLLLALCINAILNKKNLGVYIYIALLMQLHVSVIPIAAAIWFYYLGIQKINNEKINIKQNLIPVLSLILAFIQLIPPDDLMETLKIWNFSHSRYMVSTIIYKSVMLIFNADHTSIYILTVPPLAVVLIYDSWKKNRNLTIIWVCAIVLVVCAYFFLEVTKGGPTRHHFVLLFCTILTFIVILAKTIKLKFNNSWYLLLIPFFLYSAYRLRVKIADYMYAPISYASEVAEFLDKNYPEKTVIVVPEVFNPSINIYRDSLRANYSLEHKDFMLYNVWDNKGIDYSKYSQIIPVRKKRIIEEISNIPDSILLSEPVLVIGAVEPELFLDENNKEIRNDIKINDRIDLKFVKPFEKTTLNYITEKFILFEVVVKSS